MTPDQVITAAVEASGLEDFGGDEFREGLEVYCAAVAAEARLNDLGRVAVEANVVGGLANRLKVVDWAARHPAVRTEPVERPLIVIGMFRAGTTLLSNLLDCDPGNRSLLRWESSDSVPPPGPGDLRSGPRVEAAQAASDMLDQINPAIPAVHHEAANGPTECLTLLGQDFKSLLWEAMTNVPSYSRWMMAADQVSAYRYHRLALQVLQSGGERGRWALKSPHHAIALEALTTVYPDARLVLLHRDPVSLVASVCSLIRTLSGTFSDADHTAYIAEHWSAMLETSVERIDAFRAARPQHPMLDVAYRDLVDDPVRTVEGIYAFAGSELTGPAADAMRAYSAENPAGRHGTHRYEPAEFGLDPDQVRARFAGYTERYLD
ncbi:MAG: sulfotransferase [Actinomycetota bacterium]|nr:sulfotransferase [Actinomycetota bacterium]